MIEADVDVQAFAGLQRFLQVAISDATTPFHARWHRKAAVGDANRTAMEQRRGSALTQPAMTVLRVALNDHVKRMDGACIRKTNIWIGDQPTHGGRPIGIASGLVSSGGALLLGGEQILSKDEQRDAHQCQSHPTLIIRSTFDGARGMEVLGPAQSHARYSNFLNQDLRKC